MSATKVPKSLSNASGPAFSAYQSTLQSLPANTPTKILFQTEEFDTANCFASSRFTPNVAGYYLVTGGAVLNIAQADAVYVYLYKNGALYKQLDINLVTSMSLGGQGSALVSMNGSTDYIELYLEQGTVGAQDSGADAAQTYFQAFLARAA